MKKKSLGIFILLLLIFWVIGCSKSDTANSNADENPANKPSDSINKEDEKVEQDKPDDKDDKIGQDSAAGQVVDTNFAASMMPVDGVYINSTNGALPDTCEIRVKKESDNSFQFSIWQVFDENGNESNNMIFMENLAKFDSADAAAAVFQGETYTLYFDCSEPFYIKLSGFDQAVSISDKFLNMAAKFDSLEKGQ